MSTPFRPVETNTPAAKMSAPATPSEHLGRPLSNAGKTPVLLLWLLGIPVPIILIIFLMKGCS